VLVPRIGALLTGDLSIVATRTREGDGGAHIVGDTHISVENATDCEAIQ
jgi:hypothetical protein